MNIQSDETREQLINRLKRVEGQIRGVQRMLAEDRDCREIVQQLSAIRSAVQSTGLEVMRTYASQCLADPQEEISQEAVLDYLVTMIGKWG